jgi:hypothetical protein
MSLDDRMRAGVRKAAATQDVDASQAWEEVRMRSRRERTTRTLIASAAAAAALVAGAVWGPGVVDSFMDRGDPMPAGRPTEGVVPDDGEDTAPPNDEAGVPIEPGTYTYPGGPFPVTFTTKEVWFDPSPEGDPHRFLLGDPVGTLQLDFPVTVSDLTQRVTPEAAADGVGDVDESDVGELYAGPILLPDDIGAWLGGAASLRLVDEGTLALSEGEASWWDIEVSDPAARCFAGIDEPCVFLWTTAPQRDALQVRQIGAPVFGSARVYSIDAGSTPLTLVAMNRDVPDEDRNSWLAATDEIVATITLE